MRGRLAVLIAAALLTLLPVNSPGVSEAAKRCVQLRTSTARTCLRPLASAHPHGGSSPAAPKAIIEVIGFNGDGTVDTPKVTLNFNGRGPKLRYLLRPLGRLGYLADRAVGRQWVARSRGPLADVPRSLADGGGEVLDRGRRGRHGARVITVFMVAVAGWALRIDPCRTP
jgi:hypothetical protein